MSECRDAKLLQVLVPSSSAGPSRLSRSRGMPPHIFRGPGSAARPQCPWERPQSGRRIIVWGRDGVQGRLDYGCLRGSQRPLRSYRQWQGLSVIVKIPEWRRNPDFPAPEGPIFYLSARLWIIPKKHAPMFTREAYATRHHRQRSPRRWWLRAVALPPERLRSNGMLSDQGKRRQARKRPAELAAMAPKKELT